MVLQVFNSPFAPKSVISLKQGRIQILCKSACVSLLAPVPPELGPEDTFISRFLTGVIAVCPVEAEDESSILPGG